MDAVHSAKKRFVCPVCDKRFPYENSLKMHMMLHTNDRYDMGIYMAIFMSDVTFDISN